MSDPRSAFQSNPFASVEVDLAIAGVGPMFGGERRGAAHSDTEMQFARGHYEQHHRATGTIEIDGDSTAFDGLGLRDHSWGPRSWQAPRFYRWLTVAQIRRLIPVPGVFSIEFRSAAALLLHYV